MKLINKDAVIAEIERRIASLEGIGSENYLHDNYPEQYAMLVTLKSFKFSIDTLEMKEVDTWHLQEKEDIYDAVKDWYLHTFVCVMKDGTIQRFSGIRDEDFEGHINVHIDGVNDDYDSVDDIEKWIELT